MYTSITKHQICAVITYNEHEIISKCYDTDNGSYYCDNSEFLDITVPYSLFMYTYGFKLHHMTAQTSHLYVFILMILFIAYIKKLLYKNSSYADYFYINISTHTLHLHLHTLILFAHSFLFTTRNRVTLKSINTDMYAS